MLRSCKGSWPTLVLSERNHHSYGIPGLFPLLGKKELLSRRIPNWSTRFVNKDARCVTHSMAKPPMIRSPSTSNHHQTKSRRSGMANGMARGYFRGAEESVSGRDRGSSVYSRFTSRLGFEFRGDLPCFKARVLYSRLCRCKGGEPEQSRANITSGPQKYWRASRQALLSRQIVFHSEKDEA